MKNKPCALSDIRSIYILWHPGVVNTGVHPKQNTQLVPTSIFRLFLNSIVPLTIANSRRISYFVLPQHKC